ncbi:hypothetical protein FJ692_10120 [Pseudomonas fluorescens]|nr:hypothetical protein C1751_19050 [Pseudomonas fluorescens]TPV58148.1 hypothetical protein FJ692_10120 [Pseudomonas fluorescens]
MARELAPAGVRSAPRIFGTAAQPSGSKLPRHRGNQALIRRVTNRSNASPNPDALSPINRCQTPLSS